MTFKEYLNQTDPQYLLKGSVEVKETDLGYNTKNPYGRKVGLAINGKHYDFIIRTGETTLWTIDDKGNPRQRSVFKLIKDE